MATATGLHFFYQNDRVATELSGSAKRSIFRHEGGHLAQYTSGAEASHSIMAVNSTNTVIIELGFSGKEQFTYTPYGRRPNQSESSNALAFNGELLDSATGGYLLGNGYRLFSPTLKRFCSIDNLSPFEQGGLNAYAYCAGDPVNSVDPSGHFSIASAFMRASGVAWATAIVAQIAELSLKSPEAKKTARLVAGISWGVGIALVGGAVLSKKLPSCLHSRSRAPSPHPRAVRTGVDTPQVTTPRRQPVASLNESIRFSDLTQQENTPARVFSDLPPSYDSINDSVHTVPSPESPPPYNSLYARHRRSPSITSRASSIRSNGSGYS